MTSARRPRRWRLITGVALIVAGLAAYAFRRPLEEEFPVLGEFPFVAIAAIGLLLGGTGLVAAARTKPTSSDEQLSD